MNTTDPAIVSLTLMGLLCLLVVGIVLKRRGFQEWVVRLLVLYIALSALWTLGRAFARLNWLAFLGTDVLSRVLLYGMLVLSVLLLHLSRSLLRLGGIGWGWWVLALVWGAALVVLDGNLLALPEVLQVGEGWLVERQELVRGSLVLGWGMFAGGAMFLTVRTYRRTQQPLHRNRITYWALVVVLAVVGAALLFAGHRPWDSVLHLLSILCAVYIVLSYRLPDVRQMGQRAVSFLIMTLLAVIIYTAGFLAAHYLFQAVPGYTPLLAGATMALVLVILFDPLLRVAQRLVSRLISGAGYDPSRTLREYSTSISNILDLERLATVVVGLISEAMEVRRGVLFVVDHERDDGEGEGEHFDLRGVTGMGGDVPPGFLCASSPVTDYLRREYRPLTQYDIDLLPRFQGTPPEEHAWLASLDMDVYVPIYAKGEWIGLLALGPKTSGDRYFDYDLTLLSTLADQTAVALENARLFDDLRARNVEIEHLNQELTVANRELTRLDRAKSDFLNIASHELRTPLTHIRGYNDILGEMAEGGSLSADSGLPMIRGVKSGVVRLQEIVDVMLDVSKIDTETLDLHLFPVSLAPIVDEAVKVWAEALEERKLALTVESLEDLPTIIADSKRLEQAFSHLIQNAIKFTPDGGEIKITGRLLGEELPLREQFIEVAIADTGIGVAPDDLERIFEKFYRVGDVAFHSTGRAKFKGAGPGLGLTVARGVVKAHGGRIWAESPGCDEETCPGTKFYVVLPVKPPDVEARGLDALIPSTGIGADQA